ncbi:Bifunctional inhibitor/plant lipid transfer protein/seed storage helical domain [Sesbania bispinosa]|nr:Bifunctional inhibitor/plant lipid transfer protein/seed storage helical domain [Sesbania bispinosa]
MAIRFLYFAMLVLVASILVLENLPSTSAQFECVSHYETVVTECVKYVSKKKPQTPPSKACCDSVKDANATCLCNYVTPLLEKLISVDKAFFVGKTCKVKLPPSGTKCGSTTVPASLEKV